MSKDKKKRKKKGYEEEGKEEAEREFTLKMCPPSGKGRHNYYFNER